MRNTSSRFLLAARTAPREYAMTNADADYIHLMRERLGLTQTEFADLLGISRRTMIRWEQLAPARARMFVELRCAGVKQARARA